MHQYLMSQEPSTAVTEGHLSCQILGDGAHIHKNKSCKRFNAFVAFVIGKSGSDHIWVGTFHTTDDMADANTKKQELREHIGEASCDHSGESQNFQRQAAQPSFLHTITVTRSSCWIAE